MNAENNHQPGAGQSPTADPTNNSEMAPAGENQSSPSKPGASGVPRPSNASVEPCCGSTQGSGEGCDEQADPLDIARAETARMREQMLRIAADFDNFRKRTRRDIDDAVRRGREDVFRELLPVFDNLERAALHADQSSDSKAVADGVKLVLRQFTDTVGKLGIQRVSTMGEPFDPNVHEAIQQLATDDQPPGTVVAEVQSGYVWNEHLVRAAMVVVAKAPVELPVAEPVAEEPTA